MKVYVLMCGYQFEGSWIEAVFDSREKADDAKADAEKRKLNLGADFKVEEFEVE